LEAEKGRHESLGNGEYVPRTPIDDVAYVRTCLRLADDFSMGTSIQLKLHFYFYHPDQRGVYGDWVYCQPSFFRKAGLSRGKWHCLELMLKNNTPGKKDGQIKAWLDGTQIGKIEKLRFRDVSVVKIRRFTVENYFGGNNVSDTSPKDQRIYIDNYVVSTKPIGCLGASH
jgi:hypothetical protein